MTMRLGQALRGESVKLGRAIMSARQTEVFSARVVVSGIRLDTRSKSTSAAQPKVKEELSDSFEAPKNTAQKGRRSKKATSRSKAGAESGEIWIAGESVTAEREKRVKMRESSADARAKVNAILGGNAPATTTSTKEPKTQQEVHAEKVARARAKRGGKWESEEEESEVAVDDDAFKSARPGSKEWRQGRAQARKRAQQSQSRQLRPHVHPRERRNNAAASPSSAKVAPKRPRRRVGVRARWGEDYRGMGMGVDDEMLAVPQSMPPVEPALGPNVNPQRLEGVVGPVISVIGVGGAGGNAVNNMIASQLGGVEFFAVNTDAQALDRSLCDPEHKIYLGTDVTAGLGAGANPGVGRAAAVHDYELLKQAVGSSNMVFVTAGMGGGTGSGAAPVVAAAAREMGVLVVGVVSMPFFFEGPKRSKIAASGLEELRAHTDAMIVVPNQNLLNPSTATTSGTASLDGTDVAAAAAAAVLGHEHGHEEGQRQGQEQRHSRDTSLRSAFRLADQVLLTGVRSVTDLVVSPGLVNLDFADVHAVMSGAGQAVMAMGEASSRDGDDRAERAANIALSQSVCGEIDMEEAQGALVTVTGGSDLGLMEVDLIMEHVRGRVPEHCNIIFGSSFDEGIADGTGVRVSIILTGPNIVPITATTAATASAFASASGGVKSSRRKRTTDSTATSSGRSWWGSSSKKTAAEPENEQQQKKSIWSWF